MRATARIIQISSSWRKRAAPINAVHPDEMEAGSLRASAFLRNDESRLSFSISLSLFFFLYGTIKRSAEFCIISSFF